MARYVLSREEKLSCSTRNSESESSFFNWAISLLYSLCYGKTSIKQGETVLVIGPGPIGLLAAQVAKANGAKVIITGITKDKPRLDLAKEIGIDITVDSLVEDLREVILKETDGYGVDKNIWLFRICICSK